MIVQKVKYLTPFFSKAMYTAYIIQYAFPMIIGGWSVVRIFDATGNIEYVDGAPYNLSCVVALLCHYIINRLATFICNPFNPRLLSSIVKDEDYLCNCLYIDEMNITYVTLLIVYSISCPNVG